MLGYEDPVNPTFDSTTAMFEKVLTEMMEQMQQRSRGKVAVLVASHNEDTMRFTVNKYVPFCLAIKYVLPLVFPYSGHV